MVESFKSTLDEVREADILVHVADISHPGFEDQIEVVTQTLQELQALDKPVILVFNKIDAYSYIPKDEDDLTPATIKNLTLDELKNSWMARTNLHTLFISATQKENVDELKDVLYDTVKSIHVKRYPYDHFLF